jgi:hypothetical protein
MLISLQLLISIFDIKGYHDERNLKLAAHIS